MITSYFSGWEGLSASILAQVITITWEADRLPYCYTSLFNLILKQILESEEEKWKMRTDMCWFHFSLLAFCLCLKETLGFVPLNSDPSQERMALLMYSTEQIG